MDSEGEGKQIVTDDENLESDEIQEIDQGTPLNLIPFQLIKIPRGAQARAPEFATVVKGKYSKYYKQTYRQAWEQMPDFKGWLQGVEGQPTRAYCTYCQKTLHAHRLSLLKHTCTIRHQKAAQIHSEVHSTQKVKSNVHKTMDGNNIQTVIVNEDSILTDEGDNLEDHIDAQIIYTNQDDMEEVDQDQETENDHDADDDYDEEEEGESTSTGIQCNSVAKIIKPPPISTHVIDTTRGVPVTGLSVSLYKLVDGRWTYINEGLTDTLGRFSDFLNRAHFSPGRYKLHYDVDRYFEARKQECLYPFIEIVFDSSSFAEKYHFPLLLSPNSYTTYRSTHFD